MPDEPVTTAKQSGLAARITTLTAVLAAVAALLGAITNVGDQAKPLGCYFYSFSWCPPVSAPALKQTSATPTPTSSPPAIAYAQYAVFVYYQASREGEAKDVANALKAKGFQIHLEGPTDLSTTKLNKVPGDTVILPNNRGAEITDVVQPIVHNNVSEAHKRAVELFGVYDGLKKGDVQVQLW